MQLLGQVKGYLGVMGDGCWVGGGVGTLVNIWMELCVWDCVGLTLLLSIATKMLFLDCMVSLLSSLNDHLWSPASMGSLCTHLQYSLTNKGQYPLRYFEVGAANKQHFVPISNIFKFPFFMLKFTKKQTSSQWFHSNFVLGWNVSRTVDIWWWSICGTIAWA